MYRLTFLSVLIVFSLLSFSCNKDTSKSKILSIEDMLVKNNEITGWSYSGSGWVANNGSELTTYINGGAELYIKYGFIEGANQLYNGTISSSSCQITLTIYNLGTSANVSTIFDDADLGLSGALTWSDNPAGTEAKYTRSGISQNLFFCRDKYLVNVAIDSNSDESLSIIKQFAYNVDEKIKEALK